MIHNLIHIWFKIHDFRYLVWNTNKNDKEKVNQTENRFEKYNKNIFTCKIIIFTNFSPWILRLLPIFKQYICKHYQYFIQLYSK